MKYFIIVLFLIFLLGCNSVESGSCLNVTCSNHGRCELDDLEEASCTCEDGYYVDKKVNCLIKISLSCFASRQYLT